jgi:hypothetical protein
MPWYGACVCGMRVYWYKLFLHDNGSDCPDLELAQVTWPFRFCADSVCIWQLVTVRISEGRIIFCQNRAFCNVANSNRKTDIISQFFVQKWVLKVAYNTFKTA